MKKHSILFLGVAILFFFWVAWQTRITLRREREQKNSPTSLQPAGTPPLVILTTVALGGFRGLVVDLLWMRMVGLQNEGKVFEIVQLADWITKLEPQFTTVWAFHAWNMAYNISILYPNPEHRWLWVKNGIQLLRDNALKYNPDNPVLCRELGWFYQHKIGQTWDDMHAYYKLKLVSEMDQLFSGPRPVYQKPDSRIQKMREEYKLLPEIMQLIEKDYGQLDWRLPESHAFYWAYRGRRAAINPSRPNLPPNPDNDPGGCEHMMFQALATAFLQGRLFVDLNTATYLTTPRFDLLPGALKAYEDAIKRRENDIFISAYFNFLAEAIFVLHVYGNDRDAQKLFDKMLSMDPALKKETSFEKYIRDCEQLDVAKLPITDAIAWMEGLLYQGHLNSPDKKESPNELREKALCLWKKCADSSQGRKRMEILPPFSLIDEQAKQRALDRKQAAAPSAPQ